MSVNARSVTETRGSSWRAMFGAALAAAGLACATSFGANVTGVKVVEIGDAIPATASTFSVLFDPVQGPGGVAYAGRGSGGENGVFETQAGVTTQLFDNNATLPNGQSFFSFDNTPNVAGSGYVFAGFGSAYRGIVRLDGGVNIAADVNTPFPIGSSNFSSFGNTDTAGSSFAFRAASENLESAIIDANGGLNAIVASGDAVPGGNLVNILANFDYDGSNLAFRATDANGPATFLKTSSGVARVVDTTTPFPTGGTFQPNNNPLRITDDGMYFVEANDTGEGYGIFFTDGTTLTTLLTTDDFLPGGNELFTYFGDIELTSDNGLIFEAGDADFNNGIYRLELDGSGLVRTILNDDDLLNGSVVTDTSFRLGAVSGTDLAAQITTADGRGIYILNAAIPEPTSLALLAMGAAVLMRRRR